MLGVWSASCAAAVDCTVPAPVTPAWPLSPLPGPCHPTVSVSRGTNHNQRALEVHHLSLIQSDMQQERSESARERRIHVPIGPWDNSSVKSEQQPSPVNLPSPLTHPLPCHPSTAPVTPPSPVITPPPPTPSAPLLHLFNFCLLF